LYVSWFNVRQW